MDQVELPFSLRCPDHRAHVIGMLNADPSAKKTAYCYECLAENDEDGTLLKILKTVPSYLKEKAKFYEKCRQRARNAGEPPVNYIEELSKKGERLEKISQHINQEKEKVKRSFEEIRRIAMQIINEKEKECIELLDKETSCLSEAYRDFENFSMLGWPKPSEVPNMYPETDILVQKMSQIESVDQLRAFMTEIHEAARIQDECFVGGDGLFQIKKKMDDLIRGFDIPEDSLPKIQSQILNSENLENFMKDLMKGFIQQEVQVENSIVSRMKKVSTPESKILVHNQFETLRDWLPQGYKFDFELLYRGSVDGMSPVKFHEKCDNKGATITLIKCRFYRASSSSILGGFLDQSWHSNKIYSSSKEAFLFSLAEQSCNSLKCPIFEDKHENAFHGGAQYGPIFGAGHDLYIDAQFQVGQVTPNSYSNAIALRHGNKSTFNVEEVEVFQVL